MAHNRRPTRPATDRSPWEQQRQHALLLKIAQFETQGAILPVDARTLRHQLHDSPSGDWKAVETRLEQLALHWNPYQDGKDVPRAKTHPKLNFYELLALKNDGHVTTQDVKRQFRQLALLLHPDKRGMHRKRGGLKVDDVDDVHVRAEDLTQFARLRLAYETLSDPTRRAAYDIKLLEAGQPQAGAVVKDQVKLEASTDFASLEWMARVKHKMDVMERIAEWAKLLFINATELRFETGEPCTGKGCGKIVSMDRDLECAGSPRRRVYICLLHKYIHACDETCTSLFGDAELDRRVCPMRAYWLIQNWLFDQLQAATIQQEQTQQSLTPTADENDSGQPVPKKVKHEADSNPPVALNEATTSVPVTCGFKPSEIYLGDQYTRFQVEKIAECQSDVCRTNFQFLEDGIYACRRHGTPHVCTFEQCDRQELRMGSYICWVSGKVYGCEREQVGTDVRTRRVVYLDAQADENSVEMEVPVMLPLGKATDFLLEGDPSLQRSSDMSSLSPPPPDEKLWSKRPRVDSSERAYDNRSPSREVRKRIKCDRETSPVRKRLHERLTSNERAKTTSFHIFLQLPRAVAILPKVALELEEAASISDDEESVTKATTSRSKENLLQIFLHARHTVNYIKYWVEELTEQQLSVWDQQIYWGDTLIGEEADVMFLEEHGISAGCILELRLHDDCPLLVSTWNGKSVASGDGGGAPVEYNTVKISKEAEEELDDLHEEWENVVAAEEQAFEQSRRKHVREKMELCGAIDHTEVLRYYDAKSAPRLVGVTQKRAIDDGTDGMQKRQLFPPSTKAVGKGEKEAALVSITNDVLVNEQQEQVLKEIEAMRSLSNDAQPVNGVKKA